MGKKILVLSLIWAAALILGGCRFVYIEEEEKTPLDYTVLKAEEIPKEVLSLIEGKKTKEFQMTYQSGEDLYLVKGYGQQTTGGYSIQVEELGVTNKAVFFKTKLLGPQEADPGSEPSYPYIVVKIKYRKEPVQF